jgi:hypothetical protein
VAELALHSKSDAERDFAAARFLLPYWSDTWLKQGLLWAEAAEVDRAFDLWADMLQRFPKEAPRLYQEIFESIKNAPDLVDRWRQLGRRNKKCLLIFFQSAGPVEFRVELDRLLSEDPELKTFSREEKAKLFAAWYRTGDRLALLQGIQEHGDWEESAWREAAFGYAEYQDFRKAYELAARHLVPPNVPKADRTDSAAKLESRFQLLPNDIAAGLDVYFARMNAGETEKALATLETLTALPNGSKYLFYLEAQLYAKQEQWMKAWQALREFGLTDS